MKHVTLSNPFTDPCSFHKHGILWVCERLRPFASND